MDLDAFTAYLGQLQGRLRRREESAGAGYHAFVLGSTQPRVHDLETGDWVQVSQRMDLGADTLLRLSGEVLVPGEWRYGPEWEVSIRIDDEVRASLRVRTGQVRSLSDLAANVTEDRGIHDVSVRLQLVSQGGV